MPVQRKEAANSESIIESRISYIRDRLKTYLVVGLRHTTQSEAFSRREERQLSR